MSEEQSLVPFALAADDDPLILMDASDILQAAGFRTLEARDGDEALDLLELYDGAVSILFTDVHMPGMNGFELANVAAERWPELAIVVASGQATPGLGDLPEGAVFIPKPFSAKTVHGHLQQLLPDGKKPEALKRTR